MRSSAVDEDGKDASFAGQHLTLLNVPSVDDVPSALREIWWSANSDSAITYRQRVGLFTRPSVGVVVQSLLDPDVAGVMFTENPVTGADERVIEASWGLGEAVVAGLVIPDTFRVDRDGQVLERTPGLKRIAIRSPARRRHGRGGRRRPTAPRSSRLDDDQLAELDQLAHALRGGLRQGPRHRVGVRRRHAVPAAVPRGHRPSTSGDGRHRPDAAVAERPGRRAARRCRCSPGSTDARGRADRAACSRSRRFAAGETRDPGGLGRRGVLPDRLGRGDGHHPRRGAWPRSEPGDHFGEIALIDEGERPATVTATTDLVCHGLTFWEFRPLVQENGAIGWKLLQSMAKMLRDAQQEGVELTLEVSGVAVGDDVIGFTDNRSSHADLVVAPVEHLVAKPAGVGGSPSPNATPSSSRPPRAESARSRCSWRFVRVRACWAWPGRRTTSGSALTA